MVNFKTPQALEPVLAYARDRRDADRGRGLSRGNPAQRRQPAGRARGIAGARAKEIVEMQRAAGLDKAVYAVTVSERPAVGGPDLRRVVITVVP